MDFRYRRRLLDHMDQETADLIRQLCTRAGMLMEDTSVQALLIPDRSDKSLQSTIADLSDATARMTILIKAAAALL